MGPSPHTNFRIRVFGTTAVQSDDGEPLHLTASMRRMLSFIIASGPTGVSADRALTELAGGDSSANAGSRLRMDVSRLRKRISPELLPPSSGEWQLTIEPDEVDYFSLLRSGDAPLPGRPTELVALLAGEPFADAHPSPLVDEATQRALALRQALLQRVCDERPDLVDPQVLLAARGWLDRHPLNEELITFVTRCHLEVGETAGARELLSRSLAAFTELLGDSSPAFIAEFEAAVGPIRPALTGLGEPEPPRSQFLDGDEATRVLGREEEETYLAAWLEDPEARPVILEGVSGSGKTTLLRAVAQEANAQGHTVIGASAREFNSGPYSLMRRAFGQELVEHLDADPSPTVSETWAHLRSIAESHATDVLLILDDVQWLDSLSQEATAFLLRGSTPGLRILLSGRPTQNSAVWASTRGTALANGASELHLDGLQLDGVEALVQHLRPEAPLASQKRLASQVLQLSRGLPGVACPIIRDADDVMLRVAQGGTQAESLAWVADSLSTVAKEVSRAAAVLAQPFVYPTLAAMIERSDAELLEALEELVDRGILVADRVPGRATFAHSLMKDACLHGASGDLLNALHRRAAKVVDDPHQVALHRVHGMHDGEEADVALVLVASADRHFDDGALREAVVDYEAADALDAIEVPTPSLVKWANASDRLRLDGSAIRHRAFEAAMRDGSLEQALDSACSGLPEAEDAEGDPGRISLLREIDSDLLPSDDRVRHNATLARQLILTGDADAARPWVSSALREAQSDEALDYIARTKWLTEFSSTTPAARRKDPSFFPAFDAEIPHAVQLLLAIDALGAGHIDEAAERNDAILAALSHHGDTTDYWHYLLFASTIESARGNEDAAQGFSDQALEHGMRYGIRESTSAWIAQSFVRTWMSEGPAAFLTKLGDAENLQVETSILAEAAVALAFSRAGLIEEAVPLAEVLTERALAHHSFTGAGVLSVCARVLGPQANEATSIRQFLLPLSGSLLVLGGGFVCLGPVDLALASVTNGEERDRFFERSRAAVSSDGVNGWRNATEREITAIAMT